MSIKIAHYAKLELQLKVFQLKEQEVAAAAQLDALAAAAAGSESKAAAATAHALGLEQQLISQRELLAQQKHEHEELQRKLVDMENCLSQQRQKNAEHHRQTLANRNRSEGNAVASQPLTPVQASSPVQEDQLEAAAGGVGSRWSLVMKEQLRQRQLRLENEQIGEHGGGLLGRSPLPSPSTVEQLSAAAATIAMHNEHIEQMRQESEHLQSQLSMMRTRAETSEARLQQLLNSPLVQESAVSAAANLTPQRVAPSLSSMAGMFDVSAAEGSNLLQLSQLTAQVVLDCRRMTEVNHASLREIQVEKSVKIQLLFQPCSPTLKHLLGTRAIPAWPARPCARGKCKGGKCKGGKCKRNCLRGQTADATATLQHLVASRSSTCIAARSYKLSSICIRRAASTGCCYPPTLAK